MSLNRPKQQVQKSLTLSSSLNYNNNINKSKSPLFNASKYLKPALTQNQIRQIKQTFDAFDSQGNGYVNAPELIQSLQSVNYKIKQSTVYQYLMDLASDGAGQITFQTFLTLMTVKVTQNDSRQDMIQLFALFDDQKCGFLTIKNLRRLIKQLGVQASQEQIQKMIQIADFDKDGRVSEQEFYHFMTGKTEN